MKNKIYLYLLIIAGLSAQVNAQVYPFRNYSIEDGLSEATVNAIAQGSEGYIWIGTEYGLNKFDGLEFENYFEIHGLQSNKVFALYEDKSNRLWIGTAQGLNYMEADSIYYSKEYSLLDGMKIVDIYNDKNDDLWFATTNNGAWFFDADNGLTQYSKAQGFKSSQVNKIAETSDVLWFATNNGLTGLYQGNVRTFTTQHGLPGNEIRDIIADEEDNLWIATDNGLAAYKNGGFEVYNGDEGLNNNDIYTLNIDFYKRLWVGTANGVSLFEGGRFKNFLIENGLSAANIHSSLTDRDGILWFGTVNGGINLFLGDYFENYNSENGLTSSVVTSFAENDDGLFWIGTNGGGINRFDGKTFNKIGVEQGLKDDKVYALHKDSQNRIWVGMREGLAIIKNEVITNFNENRFPYKKVRHISEAKNGAIWISTYEDGLIAHKNGAFKQFTSSDGLADNTVLSTVEDDYGNIWIATYGGVSKFDGEKFVNYTVQEGLPNNAVMDITLDAQNIVWVSTFGGIAWFDGGKFKSITVDDGLPNRVCYFIKQAKNGLYWIGTNNGLVSFDADNFYSDNFLEKDRAFNILSKEQGLISDELTQGAIFEDMGGHLWVGSVEGTSHFIPDKYIPSSIAPPVQISDVIASGKFYMPKDKIKLAYDENTIEIFFSGINYTAPNKLLYAFRLDGIEDTWQRTSSRYARYPALPSGNYVFNVAARNSNGTWSENITKMNIVIKVPFWQQWWFISLAAIMIIGLILFIYSYYRTTKQVEIERMRVRIASDLHDDVGASLTEIALNSDFIREMDTNPELKKILGAIGEQSRKIVTSLDDIVWSIDSRNDTLGDLTDRMQDYLLNVLSPKNMKIEYDFEELKMQNKLPVILKENLYLIFKEAVNNIAKYSNGDLVQISMQTTDNNYTFTIFDNGTSGMGGKKTGHGLRNMEMRAKRINAGVEISHNNGFTITIKGKLNVN